LLLIKIADNEIAVSKRKSLVDEDFLNLFLACFNGDPIRLRKYT